MTNYFTASAAGGNGRFFQCLKTLSAGLLVLMLAAGCETQYPLPPTAQPGTEAAEVITLRDGDVLKISFPANANLNSTMPIRRDGMILMPLIGEVKAAGKTPKELEKDLIELYSTQLLSKEVTVDVQSSVYPIYVTGSVLRPGKVMADHPMTAFEAIMEAGGFDFAKANLKKVAVIRQEGGRSQKYILDLQRVMDGSGGNPLYLKPGDTIYVPEKFTWF